jgi:cytoskeletal protein RodZ
MKTIGSFLKSARVEKSISFEELEERTHIRVTFLQALEENRWDALPEYPVVQGFVKSVATALLLNREQSVALLRRDYPPKKLMINPKPDIANKSSFMGQRLVFVGIAFLVFLVVGGYLFYQYKTFTSPPVLVVVSPVDNQVFSPPTAEVRGQTSSDATIRVNNQPTQIDDDGNFVTEIDVSPELTEVEIKAISRSGRETIIKRTIQVVNKK